MEKTTNENKMLHFFTLSIPTINKNKTGFKSSIVSAVRIPIVSIKFNESNEILKRMYFLNLRKILLIVIWDGVKEIKTRRRDYIFEDGKEYVLNLLFINPDYFFSLKGFEYCLGFHKNNEIFYIIAKDSWQEICVLFVSIGIDISGGSLNKRHLISPNQYKLFQGLFCFYGPSASLLVSESFHKPKGRLDSKRNNFSTKENQDLIINFIKSNEELKSRILKNDLNLSKSINDKNSDQTEKSDLNTSDNKLNSGSSPMQLPSNSPSIGKDGHSNFGNSQVRKFHSLSLNSSILNTNGHSNLGTDTTKVPKPISLQDSIDKSESLKKNNPISEGKFVKIHIINFYHI